MKRKNSRRRRRRGLLVRVSIGRFSEIVVSPHALDRLSQRRIALADVFRALQAPTRTNLRADPPNKRLAWQKHEREIHVVYLERGSKLIVITAYFQ